ncbi:hypothetical protein CVIRNUC_001149 [Coccomyxa viridis]|uniref:DUF7148 domain-containing protein n=1 Tax=Coccomyxa viridis TaxID=1274662 RepID=A0AAV1HTY9_9CHLO|nr:hypothetical protein CVIRNUC_001149 [Coccomyxa viridis]
MTSFFSKQSKTAMHCSSCSYLTPLACNRMLNCGRHQWRAADSLQSVKSRRISLTGAFSARRTSSRTVQINAASAAYSKDTPHLQLATAKLQSAVDIPTFASKMYQWASTLTYQGRNMPFALPFRTDPLDTGFVLSLLRINSSGRPVSIGDITTTVEEEPDVGNVVFVRFYEAEGSGMDRRTPPPADKYKKLKASADACVDIPTIMASLPVAIKNAAKQSRSDV